MRKTGFLCVLIIALFAMISFACAADTEVAIRGQKYIDGLPSGADEEGLFTFELLYDDMTPVFDEIGLPVQAVNGPDGSFVLRAQMDAEKRQILYVREIDDAALNRTYTMDAAAHPVTVQPDGHGGLTVSPDPVHINNLLHTCMLSVYVEWRGASEPPASVTLDIYRDGKYYTTKTAAPNNGSISLFLPKDEQHGQNYEYSIIERPVRGYITEYANSAPYQAETGKAYDGGRIINTFLPETGDHSPLAPLIALNVLSALAIAVILRRRRAQ